MMYAILNKRTNEFLYETDLSRTPPIHHCSNDVMLTYGTLKDADFAFVSHKCGRDYTIVELKRPEIRCYHKPARSKEEFDFRYKPLQELIKDAYAAGMSYGKYTEFMRKKFKIQEDEEEPL